jgi:D-alanine-D-alanine ligase
MKKAVCILYGGKSGEHEVSRQSAASIIKYLDKKKYDVYAIGITKKNAWFLQKHILIEQDPQRGDYLAINENENRVSIKPGEGFFVGNEKLAVDIIFPVLHGTYGEDGTMQGLIEIVGLPYVGAGVLASALAMDKEKIKIQWQENGLPVLDYLTLAKKQFHDMEEPYRELKRSVNEKFEYPVFVKPASLGSSVGVKKINNQDDLIDAIHDAFTFDKKIIIEQGIEAREIECAVLGNDDPQVFPPGEVIPHHDYYSYEAKYLDPKGATLEIPAQIPTAIKQKIMQISLNAYKCAEVSGLARVDLFYEKKTSKVYLNEINTMPGFTNISMYPRLCAAAGLSYTDLLDALIELGLKRFKEKNDLVYSI